MPEDVVIQGGLYDITIRNALASPDDAVTGEKANIMNMALARGCWFQWEFTVQMELHMGEVEQDLEELGQIRELLADMVEWTPMQLETDAAALTDAFNELFQLGVGSALTEQASSAAVQGVAGEFAWPPQTSTTEMVLPAPDFPTGFKETPIGRWEDMRLDPDRFDPGVLYRSSDGVYFRHDGFELMSIEIEDITLIVEEPVVAGDAQIASARRELEMAIESRTQLHQDKQAQLQDIAGMLQKWFNFTTNVNERKKRDADTIAGNFH